MNGNESKQPNAVLNSLLKVPALVPQCNSDVSSVQSTYLANKISPAFARVLLDQAVSLFLAGEHESARLILHDLVRTLIGYEALAQLTNRSCANLRVMLSPKGKLGMEILSLIFRAIRDSLNVNFDVRVIQTSGTSNRKAREPRKGLSVVPGCAA